MQRLGGRVRGADRGPPAAGVLDPVAGPGPLLRAPLDSRLVSVDLGIGELGLQLPVTLGDGGDPLLQAFHGSGDCGPGDPRGGGRPAAHGTVAYFSPTSPVSPARAAARAAIATSI